MLTQRLAIALLSLTGARAFQSLFFDQLFLNDTGGNVLTTSQLSALVPYAQFARVAYCPINKIDGWQCGQACKALSDFELTLLGGDGDAIQQYFVGFWPQEKSVVVGHEGTDPLKLQSVLTDVNLGKGTLDAELFPGAPSTVEVHLGFRDQHAQTANSILAEVQKLLEKTGAQRVVTVGHSLGGALSILQGLSLRLRLPSEITVSIRTFGSPRVGDSDFVKFFNSKINDIVRVNNRQDLIPIVPPRLMGFQHPQGEIHIVYSGHAVACTGDDSNVEPCTNSMVPTLLQGNILDHLGSYEGVNIGTTFCN